MPTILQLTKIELHADEVLLDVENGAANFPCFSDIEWSLVTFPSPFVSLFIEAIGGGRIVVSFRRLLLPFAAFDINLHIGCVSLARTKPLRRKIGQVIMWDRLNVFGCVLTTNWPAATMYRMRWEVLAMKAAPHSLLKSNRRLDREREICVVHWISFPNFSVADVSVAVTFVWSRIHDDCGYCLCFHQCPNRSIFHVRLENLFSNDSPLASHFSRPLRSSELN